MIVQKMPISALHLAEKNVRKHTDKQLSEYIRSLKMFGQVKPLVVDGNGEIICGNGLYAALVEMGATECDCYVRDDLTPAQKKKLMLADNRVYELGITRVEVFEEIIRELDGDVDVPGWDEELLNALTATVDEVDDQINSYGIFAPEDTERIKRVEQRAYEAPAPVQNHDSGLLQQASGSMQEQHHIANSPEMKPQETPVPGQTVRYVICPKCGERICV